MRVIEEVGEEAFRIGLRDIPGSEYTKLVWYVDRIYGILDEAARRGEISSSFSESDELGAKKVALCQLLDSDCTAKWEKSIKPFHGLISRPYFQRGWIKQEIAIPETLTFQCGPHSVAGDSFVSFIRFDALATQAKRASLMAQVDLNQERHKSKETRFFGLWPRYDRKLLTKQLNELVEEGNILNSDLYCERFGLGQTVGIRSRFQKGGKLRSEMTLVFLLRVFMAHIKFKESEDRIYGLLGIASDTVSLGIEVDYGLRWEDVFADAVKRIVQSGNVDILTDIVEPEPENNLASWVPDFHRVKGSLLREWSFQSTKPFSAGGRLDGNPDRKVRDEDQFEVGHRMLLCRGVVVDTVAKIGQRWEPHPESGSYFANFQGYLDTITTIREFSVKSAASVEVDCIDPQEALKIRDRRMESAWRVPIMDHESFGNSLQKRRATKENAGRVMDELLNSDYATTQIFGPDVKDYLNCSAILKDYAPFLGVKGFMGLCNPRMKAGDVVCVLYGAMVPFVLRPTGDADDGTFQLIGEAYCDTIMDVEALDMGLEPRTFRLV